MDGISDGGPICSLTGHDSSGSEAYLRRLDAWVWRSWGHQLRKGAKVYLIASGVAQASALIRYTLLARILGPEQLGLAAALVLTAQFFDSISESGSDRFLVQHEDDSPRLQSFVHLVLAIRGMLTALALAAVAWPLAQLFHQPELALAMAALGLAPLITGFVNLDYRRVQRTKDFRPESAVIMISEFVGLIGTGVAVVLTHNFSAVIYGLVARALAVVVVSHIVASRPYKLAWAPEHGRVFARFALPLVFNGALLFLGSQGDRLLVGGMLGPAALGQYTAILLLISNPGAALSRFVAATHLPQFAAARANPPALLAEEEKMSGRVLLISLMATAGFAVVAPFLTPLLFGPRFAAGAELFALIGVSQSMRFLRTWPTTVAFGAGNSTIVLLNNVARLIAFPAALVGQLVAPGLHTIVGAFVLGELAALVTGVLLLGRLQPATLAPGLVRIGLFCLVSTAIVAWAWAVEGGHTLYMAGAAVASIVTSALIVRHERPVLRQFLALAIKRLKRA
ncbi:MAG: hypothetical protein JWQ29_248 [Phenylobacterium sp.]|nr:hypothetical protein [Phenylobacterium sp.]